ncbi:uncharacterized protein yc1106_01756 [Curvularia clavata]|uniref:Uncharacterized protein n=1 Tax=Curvularia clavata TaxID=95742 RepID=A0A9Q9DPF7_CURCL|nr:uncharacterized protein yc1106_01756 [Curvularia clavata]
MTSVTLSSLPDPVLHLICVYLTPDRPSVNDPENGQSPTLYRPIISFSLTAHSLSRISSTHIATNVSLTHATVRWDLFLRTVQENPTYASSVKYFKLSEPSQEELSARGQNKYLDNRDLTTMFKALSGLETLFSSHGRLNRPNTIIDRLMAEEMPLWKTLQVVRFDHINVWGEERIIELNLRREGGGGEDGTNVSKYIWENGLLTGDLAGLSAHHLLNIPDVTAVDVTTRDFEDDGDTEGDADWIEDGGDQEDEGEEWSDDDDYEYESEDSDWDSEDDSDYEDDWEAEYGFSVPSPGPKEEEGLPTPVVGSLTPGKSLLDF